MKNKVNLIGRIGADAVAKPIPGKDRFAIEFSLATTNTYTNDQGNKVEDTTWHNCIVYRKSDSVVPYLTKGTLIDLDNGRITYEKYEKEGVEMTATKIIFNDILLLTPKG
ncbi:MAG: single-stranded DNA-binding protein [Bacteroidota bacterium]